MILATQTLSLAGWHVCSARSNFRYNALETGFIRVTRYYSASSSSSSSPPSSTKPRISYRVAASCSAKGRRFDFEKNTYNLDHRVRDAIGVTLGGGGKEQAKVTSTRHKRPGSGEDAFFASTIGAAADAVPGSIIAFAVADGVGGWAEHRIDPADVSHGLCTYMAQHAFSNSLGEKLRPKDLLQKGYDSVVADESITAGGTTASVGVAQPDGSVELANLGDSGSVLLRLAAVHQYSTPQTHAFNTPYQLNIIPRRMREQAHIFGGVYFEDTPRDAAVSTLCMQHGDVLMLATDGVFDNLNNSEILKIVTGRMLQTGAWSSSPPSPPSSSSSSSSQESGAIYASERLRELTEPGALDLAPPTSTSTSTSKSKSPSTKQHHTLQALLAASIVGEAKLASVDMRRDGPFAKEAQRYYPGHWYRGGKVDDITALVVIAVEE